MGKIRSLPKGVVSKIAAGEVIQRPSDIIKELVENSIDASATKIKMAVVDGGVTKISVIDNGHGMSKEDLLNCFKSHTTSKLKNLDDLQKILSLGFRGEALHSIMSVSKVSIATRTPNSAMGYKIELSAGKLIEDHPFGMPKGTEILVENLFFNIPARRKFLKSSKLEFSHILSIVSSISLAFPKIGFEVLHNKKVVLNLPKGQEYTSRIKDILGKTLTGNLIPVSYIKPHLKITGFVSNPQSASSRKNNQYLYINNRSVIEKNLINTVRGTYGNLIEARTHPSFVLYYEFSTDLVDVNVHPRKKEVRFVNPSFLHEATSDAILTTLQKHDLTYTKQGFFETNRFLLKDKPVHNYVIDSTRDVSADVLQVHKLYLITQTETGLLMVDQHAAHERILYEQFLKAYETALPMEGSVELTTAEIFDLPINYAHLLAAHLEVFSKIGIEIEPFGNNSFKIISVPKLFVDRNIPVLIEEVLDNLSNGIKSSSADSKMKKALSYLACRSAIKAGDYLSPLQRKKLLQDLSETKTNYTCPHGRPTRVKMSLKDLEKTFRR